MAIEEKTMTATTPEGQMALFWRILHLITARYGNYPMGQCLVALTMVFLNERGKPPTMTELCRATGLPKASVSRYVSWQIKQGLAREVIDPNDRRQRRLIQTPRGKKEWNWQTEQLGVLFDEVAQSGESLEKMEAPALLERMIELTDNPPKRVR